MSSPILLAGATGAVGSRTLRLLKDAGRIVYTLSSNPKRAEGLRASGLADKVFVGDATKRDNVRGIAKDVEVIVSCLGATVALKPAERRSFAAVDTVANLHLLEEAQRSGVRRFVYLAAHRGPAYEKTAYIQAHEAVVSALQASSLSTTILRPTGIFNAFDDFLTMAKRGLAICLGSGLANTNPIHPEDVAKACVEAVDHGPASLDLGGPEILTRYQIVERAFEAIGRKPRILRIPTALFRFNAACAGLFHRRLGELMDFAIRVSSADAIAPCVGERTLLSYFRDLQDLKRLPPP